MPRVGIPSASRGRDLTAACTVTQRDKFFSLVSKPCLCGRTGRGLGVHTTRQKQTILKAMFDCVKACCSTVHSLAYIRAGEGIKTWPLEVIYDSQ